MEIRIKMLQKSIDILGKKKNLIKKWKITYLYEEKKSENWERPRGMLQLYLKLEMVHSRD